MRPPWSLRTPAPVYPGLKNVVVGFGAAGSAGKASPSPLLFTATEDGVRDGMGETRGDADEEDAAAHGVCPGFAPMRVDDAAGRLGNMLLDAAGFQLACLLTADRDDCAVELFSFNTLDPPCAVGPPLNDWPVADPGSDG